MSIGNEIKKVRLMRGFTQKELGVAVGFKDDTADVRIAQYEKGVRTPKADMLLSISEVLNVTPKFLTRQNIEEVQDIMLMLFDLEKAINMTPASVLQNIHNTNFLYPYIAKWQEEKEKLRIGAISEQAYEDWKMNYSDE